MPAANCRWAELSETGPTYGRRDSRLAGRGAHSRFERLAEGPATESRLYHATATRLAFVGWPVCALDTTASAPDEVTAIVTDRILTLLADRSADGS